MKIPVLMECTKNKFVEQENNWWNKIEFHVINQHICCHILLSIYVYTADVSLFCVFFLHSTHLWSGKVSKFFFYGCEYNQSVFAKQTVDSTILNKKLFLRDKHELRCKSH